MHFRRTSNKRKIRSELKTKHVRRRIDETKTSIEIERIAAEIGFESLGQNDLEDITGADVILGSFHRTCELVRLKIVLAGSGSKSAVGASESSTDFASASAIASIDSTARA